jgi:hypothetical protein
VSISKKKTEKKKRKEKAEKEKETHSKAKSFLLIIHPSTNVKKLLTNVLTDK